MTAPAKMPVSEKFVAQAFDHEPGSIGLFYDVNAQPVAAWVFDQGWSEPTLYGPGGEISTGLTASASTTGSGQKYDWIDDDETNPLGFVYSKRPDFPEWANGTERAFEIAPDSLVELTYDESGKRVDGNLLARTILDAGPGRFFAIVDSHRMVSLITRDKDGTWRGSSCGSDVEYLGPFPNTGDALDDVIEEWGYDTPFLYGIRPSLDGVAGISVAGNLSEVIGE